MVLTRSYSVTIGASSTEILPEVENREILDLAIRNISTGGQVISLGLGTEAVANTGLVLNAGDVAAWSQSADYKVPLNRYTGISSAVGGVVSVYLRLRD